MNKLFIRTDANQNIGMGHIMRCITIAKALKSMQCIFLVSDLKASCIVEANGFELLCLNTDYKSMDIKESDTINSLGYQYGINNILVDSYFVNNDYLLELKKQFIVGCFNCKKEWLSADYIINYNINCDKSLYKDIYKMYSTKLLLGSEYVPIREEFIGEDYIVKDYVKQVLIMTGGTDYYNFMGQFVEKICYKKLYKDIEFTLISGAYNTNLGYLQRVAENVDNVHVICNVKNVSKYMRKCDLVFSAGGATTYELCAIGVPTILFSIAENQMSESEYMGEKHIVKYIGNYVDKNFWEILEEEFIRILKDKEIRNKMSANMKKVIDGKGSIRIAKCIESLM